VFQCVNKILVSHIGAISWLYFNKIPNHCSQQYPCSKIPGFTAVFCYDKGIVNSSLQCNVKKCYLEAREVILVCLHLYKEFCGR